MIPGEILKKNRQIEIRTNRLVTEFAARGCVQSTSHSTAALLQPSAEFFGVTRAMKHGNHTDEVRLDTETNAVTVEDLDSGFAKGLAGKWKSFGVLKNAEEGSVDLSLLNGSPIKKQRHRSLARLFWTGKPAPNRPLVGRLHASPPKGSRKTRKSALDTEDGQAQTSHMNPDEEQFSCNRGSVKGNSYLFED